MSKDAGDERAQKGTSVKRAAFLKAYAEFGTIGKACEIAGVPRRTYYNWSEDILFQVQCEEAKQSAVENLENIARERAANGSDTLLIFLLKGAAPDKYRDRLTVKDESPDLSKLNADELRQYRELLSKTSQTKV